MIRKKQIKKGALDYMRPELDREYQIYIKLYNLMGGLDWSALPILIEMYEDEISDTEILVENLALIRGKLQ